jgi:hypothetical protein
VSTFSYRSAPYAPRCAAVSGESVRYSVASGRGRPVSGARQ